MEDYKEYFLEEIADELNVKQIKLFEVTGKDANTNEPVTVQVIFNYDTIKNESNGVHVYRNGVEVHAPQLKEKVIDGFLAEKRQA